jgi:hypothetical protein
VLEKVGETHRQLSLGESSPTFLNQHRRFGGKVVENNDRTVLEQPDDQIRTCDVAFIDCLKSDQCIKCFSSLQTEGIDWASVTPETPCKDVVNFLFDGGRE